MRKMNIERVGGDAMHIATSCTNCGADEKSRKREFSAQAWTVLVLWAEVQKSVVEQPICEECYNELREVLIDRVDEVEAATKAPAKKRARKAG
jgi:hypothetical protein